LDYKREKMVMSRGGFVDAFAREDLIETHILVYFGGGE
jgi:hypothetical protein